MAMSITRIANGWLVVDEEGDRYCYDEGDGRMQECVAFRGVLHKILSDMGPSYEKFGHTNINIEIGSGHKFDAEEIHEV